MTQPTDEDLKARLENLHARAVDLQGRMEAMAPQRRSGPKASRIALLALPIAIGIVTGTATSSIALGILAGVVGLVVLVWIVLKYSPPVDGALRPGSRAWEARMTNLALGAVIEQRKAEHAKTTDEAKRARLDREIAFLEKQHAENDATAASGDPSPGKGYVGFTPYDGP